MITKHNDNIPDEDIDTAEVPELGYDFFADAILTKPGESLIMKNEMTSTEAFALDTSFYHEYDDDCGLWCVLGDNTGFCYSTFAEEDEALYSAETKNQNKKALEELKFLLRK